MKFKRLKRKKYTRLERQAYYLGKIKRGLTNPNSRVYESFNNGFKGKTTNNIKPLV